MVRRIIVFNFRFYDYENSGKKQMDIINLRQNFMLIKGDVDIVCPDLEKGMIS